MLHVPSQLTGHPFGRNPWDSSGIDPLAILEVRQSMTILRNPCRGAFQLLESIDGLRCEALPGLVESAVKLALGAGTSAARFPEGVLPSLIYSIHLSPSICVYIYILFSILKSILFSLSLSLLELPEISVTDEGSDWFRILDMTRYDSTWLHMTRYDSMIIDECAVPSGAMQTFLCILLS